MLVRLVKLTFKPEEIPNFLINFEASKGKIRSFNGCLSMELLRDIKNNNIFFTHSYWVNEEALENYRKSKLFKSIWAKTKPLFIEKAEAWSVHSIDNGSNKN